jgi:hypothetical protein
MDDVRIFEFLVPSSVVLFLASFCFRSHGNFFVLIKLVCHSKFRTEFVVFLIDKMKRQIPEDFDAIEEEEEEVEYEYESDDEVEEVIASAVDVKRNPQKKGGENYSSQSKFMIDEYFFVFRFF